MKIAKKAQELLIKVLNEENLLVKNQNTTLIDQMQTQIDNQIEIIERNDSEASTLKKSLAEYVTLVENMQTQIREQKFLLEKNDSETPTNMQSLPTYTEQVSQLQKQIQQQMIQMSAHEKQIEELKVLLKKRQQQIETHNKSESDLRIKIESIKINKEQQNQEIQTLKIKIEEQNKEIQTMKIQIEKQQNEIQTLTIKKEQEIQIVNQMKLRLAKNEEKFKSQMSIQATQVEQLKKKIEYQNESRKLNLSTSNKMILFDDECKATLSDNFQSLIFKTFDGSIKKIIQLNNQKKIPNDFIKPKISKSKEFNGYVISFFTERVGLMITWNKGNNSTGWFQDN